MRRIRQQRTTGMLLNPMTEVEVGMLVTIVVGGRQLVMDGKRNSNGSPGEQDQDKRDRRGS